MAKIALDAFYALPDSVLMTAEDLEAIAAAKRANIKGRGKKRKTDAEDVFEDVALVMGF